MHTDTLITAPVSIADVRSVLMADSSSLGKLCTHSNINRWARYKPIRNTDPAFRIDTGTNYRTDNCGLYVPVCRTINDLKLAASQGWRYQGPRGNAYQDAPEWYRLSDFNGYDHAAEPFYKGFDVPGTISLDPSARFNCTPVPGNKSNTALSAEDFSYNGVSFSDMHFGIAVFSAEGVLIWAECPEVLQHPIGLQTSVPAGATISGGDTLQIIGFLSPDSFDVTVANRYGTYVPLPAGALALTTAGGAEAVGLEFSISGYLWEKTDTASSSGMPLLMLNVTATMRADTARTVEGCSIELWKGVPGETDSELLHTFFSGTIVAPASSSGAIWAQTYSVPASSVSLGEAAGAYLRFTAANGAARRVTPITSN